MRALDTWLWPYMAVSFYNEHKKMCVGCEAIMCGEQKGRLQSYKFMIDFVLTNTPLCRADSVLIFTGDDGFFTQEMVKEVGFPNARYSRDWFHLFDSGLVDIFGETGNTLVKHRTEIVDRKLVIGAYGQLTTKIYF